MKYIITLLFFIILTIFINNTNAYKDREIVRVHLQTIIGTNNIIDNHDMLSRLAPRFKRDLSKSLLAIESTSGGKKIDILPDTLYRILFSFDNDKFKTTWITVCDGNGTYLNHIDFIFTYSNDKILDLKWNLDYNTEEVHHKKKPSNFYINYRWNEIKDKDISSGLFTLFIFGVLFGGTSMLYVLSQFLTSKPMKSLPSYYNSNSANNNNNNISGSSNYNYNRQQSSSSVQQYNLSPPLQQYQDESNFIDTSKPQQQQQHQPQQTETDSQSEPIPQYKVDNNDDDEQQPDISEMESL